MYLKNSSHLPFPNRWRKDFYEKKINFKKFECFCTRIITVWCERKVVPKGGGRKYINTLLRVMKNISKKLSSGSTNHDNLFGNFLQAYHQNLKKLAQLFKF